MKPRRIGGKASVTTQRVLRKFSKTRDLYLEMSDETDRPKVLIADDVDENRELLRETIEPHGFDAFLVPNGSLAIRVAKRVLPDLILLDIRMPGDLDGFETCQKLKSDPSTKDIPIIFITVEDEKSAIVKAFQAGAIDYIIKPFSKEEALARVQTHVNLHRLAKELRMKNVALQNEIERREAAESAKTQVEEELKTEAERVSFISEQEASRWGISGFIGQSETFQNVIQNVKKVQQSNSISVLITGESGTGKELVARAVHFGSSRGKRPFIPLNCSAIPHDLAESMLFGHTKGSFSGAATDQKGYFEMANGGTLFLDEIGDLPLGLQGKFLRVLESHRFTPIGSAKEIEVDVRVVAATNRDLASYIEEQRFRSDLYFRLARFTVEVPSLRDRRDDIPLLVTHFVNLFASETGQAPPRISSESFEHLQSYGFPGNIRELKNMMERAVIEAENDEITPSDLHFFRTKKPQQRESEPKVGVQSRERNLESPPSRDGLTPEEEEILEVVSSRGSLTNAECRELLTINIDRAYYLLNKLQKGGHLRRVGGHRGARYLPA